MNKQELYWLAGLLEGEGSFMKGPPSSPNDPCISVSMTDEDVVRHVAELFGVGYVHKRDRGSHTNWRPAYSVRIRGRPAIVLMQKLQPLMGSRRQAQIEKALASYDPERCHKRRLAHYGYEKRHILDLFRRAQAGERYAVLAKEFGISEDTISRIKNGYSWGWLTQGA